MRLQWPKSYENHKAQFPKLNFFVDHKSILHHYYIQNVKDGIQIRAYEIMKESVTHFSRFILVKTSENFKKISDSLSGKVNRIEALAK